MEKVRIVRKKRQLTQKELAKKIRVSQACISRIELGIDDPSLSTFVKIAKVLNVSLEELL
jgi:DNA-binding XRE family transcriptional regulator